MMTPELRPLGMRRLVAGLLLMVVTTAALAVVSVTITPIGGFGITPGVAVVNQPIATITLNADQNYNVTLADDNNGQLRNGLNVIAYTVKYNNGSEITLSTTPTSVETGASVTNGNRSLDCFIGAAASIGIPAGTYTATVTVEILAI